MVLMGQPSGGRWLQVRGASSEGGGQEEPPGQMCAALSDERRETGFSLRFRPRSWTICIFLICLERGLNAARECVELGHCNMAAVQQRTVLLRPAR